MGPIPLPLKWLLIGWLVGLAACAPAGTAQPPPNKLGLHTLFDDGRNQWPVELWEEHLRYVPMLAGEGSYVLQLVRLDDLDPGRWQHFLDLCAQYRLKPILRLATTFNQDKGWWEAPPADYAQVAQQYATFLSQLEWPAGPHPIIVGNEPNHGGEWGGVPDPAGYARFLIATAQAIHASDPQALVLNAGLDPYAPNTNGRPFADGQIYLDEESFLDQMLAAYPHVLQHLDGWASHAYPLGPFTAPPWEQTFQVDWLNGASNPHFMPPPAWIDNRGINGYEWELLKLASYGQDLLPVFITETGWRHPAGTQFTHYPTLPTITTYLDLALYGNNNRYPDAPAGGWTPLVSDNRVEAIIFFALNGNPTEWSHTNWLALDPQGHISPTNPILLAIPPR